MWRLRYENRRPNENDCDGRRIRDYERSWGVAELGFFFDERCKDKIQLLNKGREEGDVQNTIGNRGRNLKESVITSGYKILPGQQSMSYDYYPNNVADDQTYSIFAADCGSENFNAYCDNRDWVNNH